MRRVLVGVVACIMAIMMVQCGESQAAVKVMRWHIWLYVNTLTQKCRF